jgi:hypothetical protein
MPKAHARSPGAGAAAHDDRHAVYIVSPCQQGVPESDQVTERPYLTAMRVAAEHQPHAHTRGLVSLPRGVGEKDGGSRRPGGQCL